MNLAQQLLGLAQEARDQVNRWTGDPANANSPALTEVMQLGNQLDAFLGKLRVLAAKTDKAGLLAQRAQIDAKVAQLDSIIAGN